MNLNIHKTILAALLLAVTWAPGLFPAYPASAASGPGDPAEVEAFLDGAMAAEMSTRLLFFGSLIGWSIAFFAGLRKRVKRPLLSGLAHWVAALFGIALLVFLFMLLGLMEDTLPAFGVPRLYFENPSSLGFLFAIPLVMAVLAGLMGVFMLISWVRRFWNVGGAHPLHSPYSNGSRTNLGPDLLEYALLEQ